MLIYGYLRASTKEQDATRAKAKLKKFIKEKAVESPAGALKMYPVHHYNDWH
ncbi:hypothetical protein ACYX78_14835 [Advenella incenata]|jgi:DNA invertase Pin-like site-specific DNA recombinase